MGSSNLQVMKKQEEMKSGRLDAHKLSTDFFRFIYFLLGCTVLTSALIIMKLLLEIVGTETPNFIL